MNSKVAEMVTALATGKASTADATFAAVMVEKMNAALDERKIAIASQIYNTESTESIEEDNLDEVVAYYNMSEDIQRSGNTADKSTVGQGEPVKDHGVENMDVFKRTRGGKTHFDFVEHKPRHGSDHQVYTYSPHNGNLTRGSGSKWARQELRSGSAAFHKNNPNKMAIPNDFKKAASIVHSHYQAYKPRN